jgi:hypothetical protein
LVGNEGSLLYGILLDPPFVLYLLGGSRRASKSLRRGSRCTEKDGDSLESLVGGVDLGWMENQRQKNRIGNPILGTGLVYSCGREPPKGCGVHFERSEVDSGRILERRGKKGKKEVWIGVASENHVRKEDDEVEIEVCLLE